MGIRIIPYRGSYRPYWYAEYKEGGKTKQIRLTEKIKGVPPPSLSIKDEGSPLYEKSKARAQAEFDVFEDERKRKGASERIMEDLIASKTGEKVTYYRLRDLGQLWNDIPRDEPLSASRMANNLHVAKQFADFCPHEFLYEVKPADVKGFMDHLKTLGDAWTTVKSKMSFLSGAFNKFYRGDKNPFRQIIKRNTEAEAKTIHRIPLTNEQIEALRETARGDALLYPLVECGLATGARLVDIVHLKKENIDLREGFVSYKHGADVLDCSVLPFVVLATARRIAGSPPSQNGRGGLSQSLREFHKGLLADPRAACRVYRVNESVKDYPMKRRVPHVEELAGLRDREQFAAVLRRRLRFLQWQSQQYRVYFLQGLLIRLGHSHYPLICIHLAPSPSLLSFAPFGVTSCQAVKRQTGDGGQPNDTLVIFLYSPSMQRPCVVVKLLPCQMAIRRFMEPGLKFRIVIRRVPGVRTHLLQHLDQFRIRYPIHSPPPKKASKIPISVPSPP